MRNNGFAATLLCNSAHYSGWRMEELRLRLDLFANETPHELITLDSQQVLWRSDPETTRDQRLIRKQADEVPALGVGYVRREQHQPQPGCRGGTLGQHAVGRKASVGLRNKLFQHSIAFADRTIVDVVHEIVLSDVR